MSSYTSGADVTEQYVTVWVKTNLVQTFNYVKYQMLSVLDV